MTCHVLRDPLFKNKIFTFCILFKLQASLNIGDENLRDLQPVVD